MLFGRLRLSFFLLLALTVHASAQSVSAQSIAQPPIAGESNSNPTIEPEFLFPAAYFSEGLEILHAREAGRPYWAATEGEAHASVGQESILLNNDILAFYGHPSSRNMGILGRFTKEELNEKLESLAAEYQAAGGRNIQKAFYIIFGTVWPGGEIGIIQESLLKEYIEFALENDILIFIDHQIGRYTPEDSLRRMLPWLKYPNVHLALDPEWRTTKPMQEIGTVSADEINQVQRIMEDYIIENHLPGERLLVIHQFNNRMISNREQVESNFSRVRLVHCADGFGSPAVKRSSYANNAQAANIPIKGFKLFFDFGIPGAGIDSPLLSPREVFELNPRPYVVMYQ